MKPIRKILIANRGEIALRIVRACRELGIAAVAVYSDADRNALHVLHADEAYRLGPAPASESYLRGDLILSIAQRCEADAIHPGYGFLSENAAFAALCANAGMCFIGPPASAMEALGSKTRARQAADRAGMPRTPGSTHGLASVEEACEVAASIGYPVMLKAAAGGGGKGMRVIQDAKEMSTAFAMAGSEAQNAFGSSEVYLEKFIVKPRHIEIQIAADEHGHCVSLGERECSVQRRHQKVIEECPSAVVDEDLRRRMGEAACRLALAAGYTNVGTVEFLLDSERNFYFLEMNTRLQVEHPVTELVTGIDLVQLQIRIAEGYPLSFVQTDIQQRGHAIECRIYAEDPENNFFPSPGKITRFIQPSGPGIREDCGVYEGWTVPTDYDPMLSKLIAYAPTRAGAIARLLRALDEYTISGIRCNLELFKRILADEDFQSAAIDTGYLERLLEKPAAERAQEPALLDAAALAAAFYEGVVGASSDSPKAAAAGHPTPSRWKVAARAEGPALMKMQLMMEGALRTVVLSEDGTGSGRYFGELDGTPVEMDAALIAPGVVSLILRSGPLAGHAFRFLCTHDASGLNGKTVTAGEQSFAYQVHDPRSLNSRKKRAGVGEDTLLIKASMAGRVVRVLVEAGDSVEARDGVVIIEAMKMQNELRAPRAGRIAEIRVSAGEMVGAGQVLAVLE